MPDIALENPRHPDASSVILLVDGDSGSTGECGPALEAAGYKVLTAANEREALSLLSHLGDGVDLLVADNDLPGTSGTDLAAESTRSCPARPVLLISSAPAPPQADRLAWDYVAKPVNPRRLVEAVGAIFARRENCRRRSAH